MAWKKNADGILEYYYKKEKDKQRIIQKDWFKENGYKKETFPPQFFEIIEKTLKRGYWAYAIDGDGWIHEYSKKHSRNKFEGGIKLKDREPIQELADIYGASISRKDFKNENWESQYVLKLYSKRALHFFPKLSRALGPRALDPSGPGLGPATQDPGPWDPGRWDPGPWSGPVPNQHRT